MGEPDLRRGTGGSAGASRPASRPKRRTTIGHRERLRERLLAGGADALPDYELLEMVLLGAHARRDMKPLAKALAGEIRLLQRRDRGPAGAPQGDRRGRGLRHRRAQGGARGRQPLRPRRGQAPPGALVMDGRARLLPHRAGLRRGRAVPHPVSRQAQPAHRRRGAAAGHGRPHAGLSARGGQARARACPPPRWCWCTTIPRATRRRRAPTSR